MPSTASRFKRGRGKAAFSGWRLLVAIADVSHYVKPGEPLDDDAYERATSVYFPRRVIPMLPEKLSNGLCSLNPTRTGCRHGVRHARVGEDGVDAYQFYPAVICSHARLTYTEVAAVLANTRGPEAQARRPAAAPAAPARGLPRAAEAARLRGAMDFDTVETQIVCDDNGRIEKIVPRTRNEAHRLIEESMLAANVCAADFISAGKHPSLFRVHEGPTPEKRVTLQATCGHWAWACTSVTTHAGWRCRPLRRATQDRPDAPQIHMMLLRSMQQAIYTATNAVTSAWPTAPTRTSPARSGAIPTCWCTA
jgi:ribonuclease R